MTYKETVLFIGKCLTINHEEHNRILIEEKLKSEDVDWDNVVRVSTAQYVFPALYCNLKRANFLSYLPDDLVEYMKHITDLNRERNIEIIEQAKEINTLLIENNITPIFLKGTGNLLEGLYEDIGERMVGDIDLIIDENKLDNTIEILNKNGYGRDKNHVYDNKRLNKHYPRITHLNKIAAVEVHFRITKKNRYLKYQYLKFNPNKTIDNILILNDQYKLVHTIYNSHINDHRFWYKLIPLRSCYDCYLLSHRTNSLKAIISNKKYFDILNSYLAYCYFIFNHSNSIDFEKNNKSIKYIKESIEILGSTDKRKWNEKKWNIFFKIKKETLSLLDKLRLSFFHNDVRIHLLKKIFNIKSNP